MTPGGSLRAALSAALLLFAAPGIPSAEGPVRSNLSLLETLALETLLEGVESLELSVDQPVTIVTRKPHEANDFVAKLLGRTLAERGFDVRIAVSAPVADAPPVDESLTNPPQVTNRVSESHPGRQRARQQQAASGDTTGAQADSVASADPLWGQSPKRADAEAGDSAAEGSSADADEEDTNGEGADTEDLGGSVEAMVFRSGLPAGQVVDLEILEFGVSYADARRKLLFGSVRFTRVAGAYFQLAHLRGPGGEVVQIRSAERHVVDDLTSRQRVLVGGASYPFTRPELVPPSLGRYIEPTVVVGIVGSLIYLFYTNQN